MQGRAGHVCRGYWKGSGKIQGCRDIFQGGGAGGTTFWGGDLGYDPSYGPVPGGVPTQGILMDHCEASLKVIGKELGISTYGDGDGGGAGFE